MKTNRNAFTRIELAATITALALLCALAAPLLGTTRSDSEQAACFNNLRQMGRAVRQWGDDHGERPPWMTPVSEGGLLSSWTRPGNAWHDYAILSNQLVTPKILACPADKNVKVARDWGEFTGIFFRGNSVSYPIWLHCPPERPRAIITADGNVPFGPGGGCRFNVNNVNSLRLSPVPDPNIRWTNRIHGPAGHILKNDGSVEFTTSSGLRTAVTEGLPTENAGDLHIMR